MKFAQGFARCKGYKINRKTFPCTGFYIRLPRTSFASIFNILAQIAPDWGRQKDVLGRVGKILNGYRGIFQT